MSRCCRSRLEQSHCEPRSGVAIQNSFNFQNLQFMKVIEILFVSLRNWITSLSLVMTNKHTSFRTPIRNLSMLVILYLETYNPTPRTKYSFFFIARKKERTLDKKEKQRRLKTVTKFNFKLVNSLSLRQHEFFHCFIK